MGAPRIATVECPFCGARVDLVIDAQSIGTLEHRECAEGHEFWIRAEEARVEVFTEPPE